MAVLTFHLQNRTSEGLRLSISFFLRRSHSDDALGYASAITIFVISLLIKTQKLAFNPSLWGEDVKVYIRNALDNGTASVLMPVGGYNTLIQRLGALAVVFLPLRYAEITFHLFALGAGCFVAAVVWRFSPIRSIAGRLLACAALPFLPMNSLEIWFTLVNVQWYLAIALALILTSKLTTVSRPSGPLLAAVFLMSLSGPFSILMAPAVVARALILRDFERGWPLYVVSASAILIQAATVAAQARGRLTAVPSDSVIAWVQGIFGNAVMGFFTTPTLLVIGLFVIIISAIWFWPRADAALRFQVVAILFIALAHIAAGYYSYKNYPELIGPYKLHARYFVIPYALGIVFMLSLGIGWTRYATIALVIAICAAGFRPFHHLDIAPPEADRAANGRSPTYLSSYIDLSHHLGPVNFHGRPELPDFELALKDPAPQPAPVDRLLGGQDSGDNSIPVPATCADLGTVALAFEADLATPGVFVFNASREQGPNASFHRWFQQFHHAETGTDHEAFTVPNNGVRTIRLSIPSGVVVKNARLICF